MRKGKGFTILELIISLALALIIIAVSGTFFISITKTFRRGEISSNLQLEADQIENELITMGLESEDLVMVNGLDLSSSEVKYKNIDTDTDIDIFDEQGKIQANKIKFKLIDDYYSLEVEGNKLLAKKYNPIDAEINEDGYPKILTENLDGINIRPLDYLMSSNGTLNNSKAIQVNINLKDYKGNSGIEVPLSLIIQFKNK